MSATSIYFNGRLYYKPGSYSKVDASGLEAVGLSASGIVAVVGTAVGGKPYTAVDPSDIPGTLQASTRPGQAAGYFKSGDLPEVEALVFAPSNDTRVEGGAQKIFWVKANPSAGSTTSLPATTTAAKNILSGSAVNFYADMWAALNALNLGSDLVTAARAASAMTVTSKGYGYYTTQINIQVGTGTTKGKIFTVVLDSTSEVFDNVGGDVMFAVNFQATVPADGYTTLTAAISATAMTLAFTKTNAGEDSDILNQVFEGYLTAKKVELVSSNAGDTGEVVLYGLDGTGAAIKETVTLAGLSVVQSALTYSYLFGGKANTAPAGTVTVRNLAAGTTIFTLTAGAMVKGLLVCSDMTAAKQAVTFVANGASTAKIGVFGVSDAYADANEVVTLAGAVPVSTTGKWASLTVIGLGLVAAARTVTISGNAHYLPSTIYSTVKQVTDYLDTFTGYTVSLVTGLTSFLMSDMDYLAGVGAVANTAAPVFLTGGHEGSSTPGLEGTPTASVSNWQAALDLLKKVFVNSVLVMTGDDAIHAQLKAHCAYMVGQGKMERDGFVGLCGTGTALPTKTQIKTKIIALNSRHIRAPGQQCERYNLAGTKTKFPSYYSAGLAMGMQAGSEVGTSLTFKLANTLGAYQDSTWNPADDAEELIQAGLLFMEQVDGVGFRWVRNVTSCISSSNIAYTAAEVNEAVNYAAYNFRTEMESAVGVKGFDGTISATDGVAREVLRQLMGLAITAWRSLTLSLSTDVLTVSAEIAPVISINFVQSELHLVTSTISTA